jgi:PKD repeat protein
MAAALLAGSADVSAETLLMPDRDFRRNVAEVVWGVSTLANGTAYTIDFGDGSAVQNGNVVDRSYIAFSHTYANTGTFTVTLTVGGENATAVVRVFDPAAGTEAFRDLNIHRAIQDALRYLWVSQTNRAGNFPAGITTDWGGITGSYSVDAAALVALAFQNHGYRLPNNNNAPTGLYEKYVVRRGLNFVLNGIRTINLTQQTAGNPCVGSGSGPDPDGAGSALCVGLFVNTDGSAPPNFNHSSYETPFAILALAGSGAPNRTVGEIAGTNSGGYVVGKPYSEVMQRLVNALVWGQLEVPENGRGGWYYGLNYAFGASDGSTVGWVMLGLLDGEAAGATIPAFARPQWLNALDAAFNTNGTFDYQSDNNAGSANSVNIAKTGVGMQGAFFGGRPLADTDVQNAMDFISDGWNEQNPVNGQFQSFVCQNSRFNKGCGYGMFNVFKGLKLYNVTTLPGVGRAAGPGAIPANDWHADYEDWLVANQTPTGLGATAGAWATAGASTLAFSSQTQHDPSEAALALLILAPVALVLPDPDDFGTVGLAPAASTNPPGSQHTVTATARAHSGAVIPGTTIDFLVISGPNQGKSGQDITDQNGEAHFTYQDTSVGPYPLTDQIQASIGNLKSNIVTKTWQLGFIRCDADADGDIDNADIKIIRSANRQTASGPNDPRDGNGDGKINVADVRYCQLRLTAPAAQRKR